jgi:hypothetical protein
MIALQHVLIVDQGELIRDQHDPDSHQHRHDVDQHEPIDVQLALDADQHDLDRDWHPLRARISDPYIDLRVPSARPHYLIAIAEHRKGDQHVVDYNRHRAIDLYAVLLGMEDMTYGIG